MAESKEFWEYYNKLTGLSTHFRIETFAKMFKYLDQLDRPVKIVETGCTRSNSWGDGQSTVLFDKYAKCHPGSKVWTVDISPEATAYCRFVVSDRVKITTGDSVNFLRGFIEGPVDLLYLDSFDAVLRQPMPSAIHHFNEFTAAIPLLAHDTLVVVDDSPTEYTMASIRDNGENILMDQHITGKGLLIAQYAEAIGVKPYFRGYQCGWLGLGPL